MKIVEVITVLVLYTLPQSFCIESNSAQTIPWPRSGGGMLSHQNLHSVLANVEEKLRTLDNIRYRATRWEMSMEALTRRLESIDARMRNSQTALEMKLDSLSQTIVSCDLKEELSREQLARKIESGQERLIHRMGYIESRLDSAINKLQGSMDVGMVKLETKQADLESELAEISSTVDEMKSHSVAAGDKMNHTYQAIIKLVQNVKSEMATHHQVDKINNILHGIHKHVNKSALLLELNDGPSVHSREDSNIIDTLTVEIGSEAQKIGHKVNNMYNDIWKKVLSVEELVRNSIKSNNVTRKEMKECLVMAMDSRDSEANDNYIEIAVDSLASMFHKKLNDLNRKVDNNFERVVTYQNMFIETCHRLQDDEPKLETKVSLILEKILDTLLNRTSHVDRQLIEVMEALKAHNGQVVRTIAQTTNMVMTLAEESSEQHKNLDGIMYEMSEKSEIIETNLQEFQDIMQENINDTLSKFSQRLEIFEKNIKIQEQQNKCDNSKTVIKPEENITDVNFNRENEKSNAAESKQNSLNVIEANYEQGVVKIMTEIVPQSNDTKEETSKQTEIDAIHSKSLPDNVESWQIPLLILNKSLNLDSLTAIIHEPFPKPSNLDNSEENQSTTNENVDSVKSEALNKEIKNDTEVQEIIKSENSPKLIKNEKPTNLEKPLFPSNEVDYKTHNEYAVSESTAINILMSYFTKVQKGHMSKYEFLSQADPMHQFSSIQEMIRSLKGNKFIPTDFLKDLEEWDKSDTKRNHHYRHQLPESKDSQNEDYNFTSYEDSYESEATS